MCTGRAAEGRDCAGRGAARTRTLGDGRRVAAFSVGVACSSAGTVSGGVAVVVGAAVLFGSSGSSGVGTAAMFNQVEGRGDGRAVEPASEWAPARFAVGVDGNEPGGEQLCWEIVLEL